MSQFCVSSHPPPSDISVPWMTCDRQWTTQIVEDHNYLTQKDNLHEQDQKEQKL